MCNICEIVKAAFAGAKAEPYLNCLPVHALLSALLKQGRLEIYAGDCRFDEMRDVLEKETHFTVCFYFKCPECGEFYFFGECIRGTPIFKVIDDIGKVNIDSMIWDREGTYFQKERNNG